MQHTNDAVTGDTGANLVQIQGPQMFGDQLRSLDFPVRQLGVLMQMPPPAHNLIGDSGGTGVQFTVDRL
ncbi:hypothetical protein GCM10027088_69520 [Nocardia goodfellowii]